MLLALAHRFAYPMLACGALAAFAVAPVDLKSTVAEVRPALRSKSPSDRLGALQKEIVRALAGGDGSRSEQWKRWFEKNRGLFTEKLGKATGVVDATLRDRREKTKSGGK